MGLIVILTCLPVFESSPYFLIKIARYSRYWKNFDKRPNEELTYNGVVRAKGQELIFNHAAFDIA